MPLGRVATRISTFIRHPCPPADDWRSRFVTVKAYAAAGGRVVTDLFRIEGEDISPIPRCSKANIVYDNVRWSTAISTVDGSFFV
jgi:hypothetical protein